MLYNVSLSANLPPVEQPESDEKNDATNVESPSPPDTEEDDEQTQQPPPPPPPTSAPQHVSRAI